MIYFAEIPAIQLLRFLSRILMRPAVRYEGRTEAATGVAL